MNIKDFQEKVIEAFSEMDKMPNRCEHTKQSAVIHLRNKKEIDNFVEEFKKH